MNLLDIITEQTIKVGLESIDKEECIAELIDVLARAGKIGDRNAALEAVLAREVDFPTGVGNGFAIPHAKSESFEGLSVAVGISRAGIDFDADDGKPATVIFMILVSENEPVLHLSALAEVARLVNIPNINSHLRAATSPAQIISILSENY